jgi:hypothetical protein
MSLRLVAYLFALAVLALTVPFTLAAGARGLVVAVLGGTLAVTPYVMVRALEEVQKPPSRSNGDPRFFEKSSETATSFPGFW